MKITDHFNGIHQPIAICECRLQIRDGDVANHRVQRNRKVARFENADKSVLREVIYAVHCGKLRHQRKVPCVDSAFGDETQTAHYILVLIAEISQREQRSYVVVVGVAEFRPVLRETDFVGGVGVSETAFQLP